MRYLCHIYDMWHNYQHHSLQLLTCCLISIILILASSISVPFVSPFLERLNRQVYDFTVRSHSIDTPYALEPPIILIDIDDNSMIYEEGWPWARKRIAQLIDAIGAQAPSLIVLHEVFTSNFQHPLDELGNALGEAGQTTMEKLDPLYDEMDQDLHLIESLRKHEVILGAIFHAQQSGIRRENNLLADGKEPPTDFLPKTWQGNGYSANTSKIQRAAQGEGHLNLITDNDGVVRRIPLFLQYDNLLYPSIALRAAQRFLLTDNYQILTSNYRNQPIYTGIKLLNSEIKTNLRGEMLIPYGSTHTIFQKISAVDILEKRQVSSLEGAIVFIGSSISLLNANKSTPARSDMHNFEIQAHALQGILHPEILWYQPPWQDTAVIIGLIILTLVMLILYPLGRPHHLLVLGIALIATVILTSFSLRESQQAYLPTVSQLLLIVIVTLIFLVTGLFRESRNRSQLQHIFGQYVPPEHIQHMLNQPKTAVSFAGERREMTVLFADLHHFTELSERLSTQALKQFLNSYLTPATEVIFEHNGTIDKYIGDLIMAFWGAPLPDTQHAQHAVLSALALQQMLRDKQADFAAAGINQVKLGIGINTGFMNVGEMGSDYRRAYTVLGDSVNLASRLEPLTRYYQVDILVSEHTQRQCPDIVFRTIDQVQVKGKTQSILLYQPLGKRDEQTEAQRLQLALHEQALQAYWQRDWDKAAQQLAHLQATNPEDPLWALYQRRIRSAQQGTLGQDWNGTHTHQQKSFE